MRVVEPAGKLLMVRLTSVGDSLAEGMVETEQEHRPEPMSQVTMALAVLPAGPLEEALERCTELGAAAFVLIQAERSVARGAKPERWAKICREAAMLAGRLHVPAVSGPLAPEFAWSAAQEPYLLDMSAPGRLADLPQPRDITLFVGPEGGWAPTELDAAGARKVSLGPRNLRAQAAAAAALAVALAGRGDL